MVNEQQETLSTPGISSNIQMEQLLMISAWVSDRLYRLVRAEKVVDVATELSLSRVCQ